MLVTSLIIQNDIESLSPSCSINEPLKTCAYSLSYEEIKKIADEKGWTKTPKWLSSGKYDNNEPGKGIVALLEKHKFNPSELLVKLTT